MKRYLGLLFAIVLIVGVAAPVAASGQAKVQVDDDGLDCPAAAYTTIQDAIDAVAPGTKIEVCSGTYAGAHVTKAVDLKAKGTVIINDGPYSHPGRFKAGFLFTSDGSGSGASIEGFIIQGAQQFSGDDGLIDFAVYSRGTDNVTIKKNVITDTLQGITAWNGSSWKIEKNEITDLWAANGGGIAIFVGAFDGGSYSGHTIKKNEISGTVTVLPGDYGGYDASGIVLYADFRWGRAGATALTGNKIEKNEIDLVSDTPGVVNVNAIEITESAVIHTGVISGNTIKKNKISDIGGSGIVVTGSPGNTFEKNKVGSSGVFDIFDDTTGSGTAGTGNTYKKNKCATSSPAGLCA